MWRPKEAAHADAKHADQQDQDGEPRQPPQGSLNAYAHLTSHKGPNYTRNSFARSASGDPRMRDGSAIPPVRKMRIPSSTLMSGNVARSRSQITTSPRYRLLVGTKTAIIGSAPRPRSTTNSRVRNPSVSPRFESSIITTRLNPDSFSGENAAMSCFTGE